MVQDFVHNVIHIATTFLSILLLCLSYLAYRKHKNQRFFYISAAFLFFGTKEALLFISTMGLFSSADAVLFHIFNLIILLLLAVGVFHGNKS